METKALEVIEKLAAQLGTTSEYLWGIMLRKAKLAAYMDLVQYVIVILGCIGCYFLWKFAIKKVEGDDCWDETFYTLPGIVTTLLVILLIAVFFCFPNTYYALVDPEVWVLTEILSMLKK